jgi:hypothetical protein
VVLVVVRVVEVEVDVIVVDVVEVERYLCVVVKCYNKNTKECSGLPAWDDARAAYQH